MLHPRPRARPLAACRYRLSRRVSFSSLNADACVSEAARQGKTAEITAELREVRSHYPLSNCPSNSPSFVDVSDETVTALVVVEEESTNLSCTEWPPHVHLPEAAGR